MSLKDSVVSALQQVDYTDPNGACYAIDGAGNLQSASAKVRTYGTYATTASSFDIVVMNNSGVALEGDALTVALENLKAGGKSYAIYATGDTVTRVTLTDPTSGEEGTAAEKFAAAMGGAGTGTEHIGQTVAIGSVTFTGSPAAASFTGGVSFYWSVSGNTNNSVPSTGSAPANNNTGNGSLTISIEEK